MTLRLDNDLLLHAYANGFFPMAESRDAEEVFWFQPEVRAILPLETFHVPRSLAKFMKRMPYRITVDSCFDQVIRQCSTIRRQDEKDSWINTEIIRAYNVLHQDGHAHSIECWEGDRLVGGLYGVSLGGAFFGESMFSLADNASKSALVVLVDILREAGYGLLDSQYRNQHMEQFGIEDIPAEDYLSQLKYALNISPNPSMRFSTAAGTILSAVGSPVR